MTMGDPQERGGCNCPAGSYNPGSVHEPYCRTQERGGATGSKWPDDSPNATYDRMEAEIDRLTAQLAERDARIQELERQNEECHGVRQLYVDEMRPLRAQIEAMRGVVEQFKRYDALLQSWGARIDGGSQHLGDVPELDEVYAAILEALDKAALDQAKSRV